MLQQLRNITQPKLHISAGQPDFIILHPIQTVLFGHQLVTTGALFWPKQNSFKTV